MEKNKLFLHICIGVSIVICSLSLLIFSTRQNRAVAQASGATLPSGIVVAGPVMVGSGFSANYYILGYNPADGKVSVLGKISPKDIRE